MPAFRRTAVRMAVSVAQHYNYTDQLLTSNVSGIDQHSPVAEQMEFGTTAIDEVGASWVLI